MSNSYLGDEPLYDNDPFIGGALPTEKDDIYFKEFYDDDRMHDERTMRGEPVERMEEFDFFRGDNTSPFSLDLNGPSDGFSMDAIYDQFNFDLLTNFSDTVMPDVEEPKTRMDAIIDEVTLCTNNESHSDKVTFSSVPEPTNNDRLVPVINAVLEGTTIPEHEEIISSCQLPSAPAAAKNKTKKLAHNRVGSGGFQRPIASRPARPSKQRTLYPVKISKVLPQGNRHAAIANSPYAIGPVPPRRLVGYDGENRPDAAHTEPNTAFEFTNGKCLKPSSVIPRDHASNHQRCSQCQSSFTSQLALEFHEVEKHANVYAFECSICNKVYADIREANKHIMADHGRETVPLLDSSIFGNGEVSENGKKGSQRRISGMIWSFLSKHLAQSGKQKGTPEHNEVVNKEVRAMFNPNMNEMTNQQDGNDSEDSLLNKIQIEETATINDLLKQQYIYGQYLRRILLSSVPPSQVIRRRYYELKPDHKPVPNFLLDEPHQRRVMQKPALNRNSHVYQNSSYVLPTRQQVYYNTSFVQNMSIANNPEQKNNLGNVYLSKPYQGMYVLADKSGSKRPGGPQNLDNRRKIVKVEMPPLLEHYAARDKAPAHTKPASIQS